jgi:hypothetical protein
LTSVSCSSSLNALRRVRMCASFDDTESGTSNAPGAR